MGACVASRRSLHSSLCTEKGCFAPTHHALGCDPCERQLLSCGETGQLSLQRHGTRQARETPGDPRPPPQQREHMAKGSERRLGIARFNYFGKSILAVKFRCPQCEGFGTIVTECFYFQLVKHSRPLPFSCIYGDTPQAGMSPPGMSAFKTSRRGPYYRIKT